MTTQEISTSSSRTAEPGVEQMLTGSSDPPQKNDQTSAQDLRNSVDKVVEMWKEAAVRL
jgi:hypothetical protein